jgi:hypothetical protein
MASQIVSIDTGLESVPPQFFGDASKINSMIFGVEQITQFYPDSSKIFSIVAAFDAAPLPTIIIIN